MQFGVTPSSFNAPKYKDMCRGWGGGAGTNILQKLYKKKIKIDEDKNGFASEKEIVSIHIRRL